MKEKTIAYQQAMRKFLLKRSKPLKLEVALKKFRTFIFGPQEAFML